MLFGLQNLLQTSFCYYTKNSDVIAAKFICCNGFLFESYIAI